MGEDVRGKKKTTRVSKKTNLADSAGGHLGGGLVALVVLTALLCLPLAQLPDVLGALRHVA